MIEDTCSIACAASAVADWIEPIWAAISSVARAVCAASDFTSEATTAKPRPASPARAASMVALSASRLVWPAIAWISPTTSPMRLAALPSSDMVLTVRLDSATARPATSVDLVACEAISPIEAASSSIELATVVTLTEAAPTRFSAARASEDTASAALLRPLDAVFQAAGGFAQPGQRLFDRRCGTCRSSRRWSRRAARARRWFRSARRPAARARSCCRGTPRTVRAMAPISSWEWVAGMRAEVSPSASRFIAAARPSSGRVMRAADPPAAGRARSAPPPAHPDDEIAGCARATRQARSRRRRRCRAPRR